MYLFPFGWTDFDSNFNFLNGLIALHHLWVWLYGPEGKLIICVLIAIAMARATFLILSKAPGWFAKALMLLLLLPIWVMANSREVPVTFVSPAAISSMVSQAKDLTLTDKLALAVAKKSGAGVKLATRRLSAAQAELAELQDIQARPVVTHIPILFSSFYEAGAFVFSNYDHIIKSAMPKVREMQVPVRVDPLLKIAVNLVQGIQEYLFFLFPLSCFFLFIGSLWPGLFTRSVWMVINVQFGMFFLASVDFLIDGSGLPPTSQSILLIANFFLGFLVVLLMAEMRPRFHRACLGVEAQWLRDVDVLHAWLNPKVAKLLGLYKDVDGEGR